MIRISNVRLPSGGRVAVVTAAALAIAAVTPGIARAQNFDSVQVRALDVAPGVHMLVGAGGNIGVSSGEDGVFLVDDQFAPLTEKIRAAIATFSDAPIRFVLNTHWHGDHTGGNENLGEAGVVIVAQDNVRKRMSVDQFIEAMNRTVKAAPKAALPIVTFTDDVTFHLNGEDIHAFHVKNAHTDGDVVVHFRKANVIHTGDVYFNGGYPFIDLSSGGSIDGMIAAASRVLELAGPSTRIIPGHGPLSNPAELRDYRDMLVKTRAAVQSEIAAGKSLDATLSDRPTADLDARWGERFMKPDQFVTIVYKSLSADGG